jgi:hypothetical protein
MGIGFVIVNNDVVRIEKANVFGCVVERLTHLLTFTKRTTPQISPTTNRVSIKLIFDGRNVSIVLILLYPIFCVLRPVFRFSVAVCVSFFSSIQFCSVHWFEAELRTIPWSLLSYVEKLWKEADSNKSGKLNIDELRTLLKRLNLKLEPSDLKKRLKVYELYFQSLISLW